MKYQLSTNDREDFYMAFHGKDFYFTLWDLDNDVLRQNIKYNEKLSKKELAVYEKIRDDLRDLMSEHGIDFEHVS